MIFSVIISEKGGAERRESFERTEINVGRVQGNDLMLPKGNVSKRHARLLYRDGRFIVTDLKSTNGTYVNGRKISQATIVREGDKIYVGDFVLRIEAGPGAQASTTRQQGGDEAVLPADAGQLDMPMSGQPDAPSFAPGKPGEDAQIGEHSEVLSQAPPDHEGPIVPGPPRLPRTGPAKQTGAGLGGPTTVAPIPVTTPTPPPHVAGSKGTNSSVPPHPGMTPTPPPPRQVTISSHPPGARDSVTGPGRAYRTTLATLLDRVGEVIDFGQLPLGTPIDPALSARIANAVAERATQMKAAGQIPDGSTVEQFVLDARRELLELGPLSPLLADDDVIEVHVESNERVLAYRRSRKSPTSEVPFTSERSLVRALRKLSTTSRFTWTEGTNIIELRTAEGLRISSVAPSLGTKGVVVVVRKAQRSEATTLDDLVRTGMISRAMATMLSHATLGRTSMLVTGSAGSGQAHLMSALANAAGADERTIVLQDEDEIAVGHSNALSIWLPPADALEVTRAAARMRPDRLIMGSMAGLAAEVLGAPGEGVDSIIAGLRAPTLRQALARLTTDLMLARPGLSTEAARECIVGTFHLALEVTRLRDGRPRLLRLAELRIDAGSLVARDIFVFNIERAAAGGPIEGAHQPTGVVPTIVDDLAARGVTLDAQIFRRNTGK